MAHACDLCNRIFSYPFFLKLHYRSHTGEKPYQCEFCKKLFSHEAHLIVHNQIHIQKEQYVCELCNDTFLQKSSLQEHTEMHKDERKDEACLIDGLPSENGLDRQNVTLRQEKQNTCIICNDIFSKECDLNRHFLAHKDAKPHSSDKKCGEQLSKKFKLSVRNRVRNTQRYFICDTRGKAFLK
ncbi:Zinc finger protein 45, partial [Araneus ventricosus]